MRSHRRAARTCHRRFCRLKSTIPLTKGFKEDRQGTDGTVDTGKSILRDYINGTIGFEELSDRTHTPAMSLMRMFGPKGNPQAKNLFDVIATLQQAEGVQFQVR